MMKRNIHVQASFPDFLSNSVNDSNKLCSDSFIALGQLGTMQGTFPPPNAQPFSNAFTTEIVHSSFATAGTGTGPK